MCVANISFHFISSGLAEWRLHLLMSSTMTFFMSRLLAIAFAYAACVIRSWNAVCEHVLSRPKLISAVCVNPSLQCWIKYYLSLFVLIASVGGSYCLDDDDVEVMEEAHNRIAEVLGSEVPIVINSPEGVIARDAFSNEIAEVNCKSIYDPGVVMLIVGFIPGMKVTTIPLSIQYEDLETETGETVMTDEFVSDIREFSTSVSGSQSPAAIIVFSGYGARTKDIMETLDYAMPPETAIVGEDYSLFRYTNDDYDDDAIPFPAAVALVFAADRNKPLGIGKTRFYDVLSSGLSPVGPTYKATSVIEKDASSCIAARREESLENLNGQTILNHVYEELVDRIQNCDLYIGASNNSIGQDKVGCMSSFAFYKVCGSYEKYFCVSEDRIKTGDTFRFYHPDSTSALSSASVIFSHMRSFNSNTTGCDKQEVFGGLIFASGERLFSQPNTDSSLFSDNFPGVTLGGTFC